GGADAVVAEHHVLPVRGDGCDHQRIGGAVQLALSALSVETTHHHHLVSLAVGPGIHEVDSVGTEGSVVCATVVRQPVHSPGLQVGQPQVGGAASRTGRHQGAPAVGRQV